MKINSSLNKKINVIINYLSIVLMIAFFELGIKIGWNMAIIVGEAIFIITLIFSFLFAYGKTKLWKLTHTGYRKLTEEQKKITNKSIRYSYGIFSVICLLIILFLVLTEKHIKVFSLVGLIYFAHILPASVIAFMESKSIIDFNKNENQTF